MGQRDNGLTKCARGGVAAFASAMLVVGLVPAAAFGAPSAQLDEAAAAVAEAQGNPRDDAASSASPEGGPAGLTGTGSAGASSGQEPSSREPFDMTPAGSSDATPPDTASSAGDSPSQSQAAQPSAADASEPGAVDDASETDSASPAVYTDVVPGSWYEPGVIFCQQKRIMTGIAGTTLFGVGQGLTRAELAVMMWRYAEPEAANAYRNDAANTTGMGDVMSQTWYTAAANWAVANKVINGFPQGDGSFSFEPDTPVTIGQLCTIVANFNQVGSDYDTSSLSRFSDCGEVPGWAARGLAWCVDAGLVSGYNDGAGIFELRANEQLPRERAATVFMRGYDVGVFDDGSASLAAPCDDLGISGYWFIRPASAEGLSLTAESEADGANVSIAFVGTQLSQTFTFEYADGYYHIVCAESGLALETAPGVASSPSNVTLGRTVAQSKRQQWAGVRTQDGSLRFQNLATGYWLAVGGEQAGANVEAEADPSVESSMFSLVAQDDLLSEGIFTIAPKGDSSKALDVTSASTADGANVQLWDGNGSLAQKWYVKRASGRANTYTLQSLCSGKQLASDSDGNVVQRAADGTDAQEWRADVRGGLVTLTNLGNGRVLDLSGGSTSSGTNVQTWASNGTDAQLFVLRETQPLPDGLYTLRLSGSDQVIDVSDGSLDAGANVQTWASNGSGAQIWRVSRNEDGSYTLMNVGSKMALDVCDGLIAAGSNVQQYDENGTAAQKWRIDYNGDGTFALGASADASFALGASGDANGSNAELVSRDRAARFTFQTATMPDKVGYQNPSGYYQVSSKSVTLPDYASGYFTYVTPSRIAPDATRQDCIDAFIDRAYDYIGTAYRWNYSMEPGVGVDCIGLVYQCLYATGMDLGEFNPYDHYATGSDGWHSHDANNMWDYGDVLHLPLSMRQRGDVISWEGHVAIYLGDDMIIDAYGPVGVHDMWSRGVPRGVLRFYQ